MPGFDLLNCPTKFLREVKTHVSGEILIILTDYIA